MFDEASDDDEPKECPASWLSLEADGSNLALEHFPSFRLALASTHVHRTVTSVYLHPYGLTLPEWRILSTVARWSEVPMRDICARSNMDKAQISRTVGDLVSTGLIERTADPTHGKRQILRATATGRRIVKRILPDAQRSQAALLAALSTSERAALFSALGKLSAAATRFAAASPHGQRKKQGPRRPKATEKDRGHAEPRRQ
jgi:DNA-binding MarR family transcriptional regulator